MSVEVANAEPPRRGIRAVVLPDALRAIVLGKRTYRFVAAAGLTFLLFWFLYGIKPTFLPTYTSRFILLIAYGVFGLTALATVRASLPSAAAPSAALYGLFLIWVIFTTVLSGAADISILSSTLLILFHSFAGGLFFAHAFRILRFDFRSVLLTVQITTVVQAFFIALYFLSKEFRDITNTYIPQGGNVGDLKIDPEQTLLRSKGLTHSGGATLSLLQSFGLLFTAYLLLTVRKRAEFMYLVASFGLLLLSIFLSGRTGLLAVPIVVAYFMIVIFFRGAIPKNVVYSVLLAPIFAGAAFLLLRYLYQSVFGGWSTSWGEDGFDRVVRWVAQEFISDGRFKLNTVERLAERHWFLPADMRTFILGDPTTWSLHRIRSDVGYVRMLFGTGLVGWVLFYAFYVSVFVRITRCAAGVEQWALLLLMSMFLLVTDLKEPFLMHVGVNSFIFLLFAQTLVVRKLHDPRTENGASFVSHSAKLGPPPKTKT